MDEIKLMGSAGHPMSVAEPDGDGEVEFYIEGDDRDACAYLDEADRVRLVHFLLKYTAVPGVTLHGRA
jgi:hypothetical protein